MKNVCRENFLRRLVLLVVVVLALASVLTACDTGSNIRSHYDLDVVKQTSNFYVNDFAGVFTNQQISELMDKAVAFDKEYSGIQVVITTVPSLNEAVLGYEYVVRDAENNIVEEAGETKPKEEPQFTIEQVAYSMYSQYGIGQDDMGILILFSTGDREVRIETGRKMQFYITDTISGRLLDDYGMEYFSNNRFAEGLISVQAATIEKIKSHVSVDWYTASAEEENPKETETTTSVVVGDSGNESGRNNVESGSGANEKDPNKGIVWGFFGSIGAAFVALCAFIRQKSNSKNFAKAKEEELNSLRADSENALQERDRTHQSEIVALVDKHARSSRQRDLRIKELEEKLRDAQTKARRLENLLDEQTDKYSRIQQLHPDCDFDKEVQEMIESEYKTDAAKMDAILNPVIKTPATRENYNFFKEALSLYDRADPNIRKYVSCERVTIQGLYDEAIRLKEEHEKEEQEKQDKAAANNAYEKINNVYSENQRGNYSTYEALHAALVIYLALTAAQKAFFPDQSLISNLKDAHTLAEIDYNNYNEAKKVEREIQSVIGNMSFADEDDREKLERAMRKYRNLSSAEQKYFSDSLHSKLRRLLKEAEEDHRRQQVRRREERRAASRYNSFGRPSSRTTTTYGGRGGKPGASGATRRF